jgi:FkbM family methyltransferase
MSESLRHKTTAPARRALAIDDLRKKLELALGKLEGLEFIPPLINQMAATVQGAATKINQLAYTINDATSRLTATYQQVEMLGDNLHARARRTENELRKVEEHFERLSLFLKTFDERFKSLDELLCARALISEAWLPEDHFVHSEPEYYLVAFLYNFLPNRVLLDVGANVGDFAEVVSDSGYLVYSFEPFPAAFDRLKTRTASRGNVKTFNFALGSTETTLPLYVASESSEDGRDDPSLYNTFRPHYVRDGLAFSEAVDVPVRTIESMVKSGELPPRIDFLKVDTEGFDLEVIKGLGDIRPAVVQSEFWGDEFVFLRYEENRQNLPSSAEIVREMRNRDYFWNIIVFRIEAENYVRFGTNLASAPKKAWGNILFFRDHHLFLEALRWCQGALPRFQALAPAGFRTSTGLPQKLGR